jgi:hypothetical protein
MRYLIKDYAGTVLAEVHVPEGEIATVVFDNAEHPQLQYIAVDLSDDGLVTAGHWPDGEHFIQAIRTSGTRYVA